MTTRSQVTTTAYPGSSRVHREDLTVQVELSTVVASDYARGERNSCMQPDAKVRDVKVARQTVSFGPIDGEAEEDDQVMSPAMDKAERGALADLDVGVGARRDESLLSPPRPVAFELTSLSQNIRQRREEAAREQAEEEEFMRII